MNNFNYTITQVIPMKILISTTYHNIQVKADKFNRFAKQTGGSYGEKTKAKTSRLKIKQRWLWSWLSHVFRTEADRILMTELSWTPAG